MRKSVFAGMACLTLAACGSPESETADTTELAPDQALVEGAAAGEDPASEDMAAAPFAWPDSLSVMGDGYPASGDPCRRLGESAATVNYLDDSAMLVGCPGSADDAASKAVMTAGKATVAGEVDGVTLISVARAVPVMAEAPPPAAQTLSGSITGNNIGEHSFAAKSGQTINVTLKGKGTIYFNVMPPGGTPGDAIYVGSRDADGKFFSGVAPATGDYKIIVYLMGNDKDSGATRPYTLEVVAE